MEPQKTVTADFFNNSGFEYNDELLMFKLTDVLFYDARDYTIYCYNEREDQLIPITYEVKTEQQLTDFYRLLVNDTLPINH